jgi:hypothetical protein
MIKPDKLGGMPVFPTPYRTHPVFRPIVKHYSKEITLKITCIYAMMPVKRKSNKILVRRSK